MLTASRVTWFAVTFALVLPGMLMMFRGDDEPARSWTLSIVFAACVATMIAIVIGKGRP